MRKLYIPVPEDFSFGECCWYLDRGFDDCVYKVKGERIVKALRLDGQELLVEVTGGNGCLGVTVIKGTPDRDKLAAYIREWMDIDRDLGPFYELLGKDKRLYYMSRDFKGLRLVGIVDLFEALSWSIIGQQINLKFAYTLKRRLVEKYGSALSYEGETYHLFPDCGVLAAADAADLRAMQFSRSKAAYLTGLADAFSRGELSREKLLALPDRESRLQELMKIKGIGVWTANYCLMKSLRDPSGIPHGDAGLLAALIKHGIIKDRGDEIKIERFFSRYKGWESYVVFYLWRSLAARPAGGAANEMSLPPPSR